MIPFEVEVPGRWAVTLIFKLRAPIPFLISLLFLPKSSGFSILLAFSTFSFIVCTHDSSSDSLLTGAHNEKSSLKCQPGDVFAEKDRISGISS